MSLQLGNVALLTLLFTYGEIESRRRKEPAQFLARPLRHTRPLGKHPLSRQCCHPAAGGQGSSQGHHHMEEDGSGITHLGRFKESKNILALAGLWELIRLPRWNSCLLLPHRPQGGKGRQVWEAQGGMPGPVGGSQEDQSPAGYRPSFFSTWLVLQNQ